MALPDEHGQTVAQPVPAGDVRDLLPRQLATFRNSEDRWPWDSCPCRVWVRPRPGWGRRRRTRPSALAPGLFPSAHYPQHRREQQNDGRSWPPRSTTSLPHYPHLFPHHGSPFFPARHFVSHFIRSLTESLPGWRRTSARLLPKPHHMPAAPSIPATLSAHLTGRRSANREPIFPGSTPFQISLRCI